MKHSSVKELRGSSVQRLLAASWLRRAILCALFCGGGVPSAVAADPAVDAFFEEMHRHEQREEDRERRVPTPDVRLQPETEPAGVEALPREQPCFTILTVRIEGDTNNQFPWLQREADRFLNQCIGVEGINVIVRRLQSSVLNRGFTTTRIYIPKQDLTSATLTLVIVPGVINQIRFADDNGRGSWRTAFPAEPGDLVNLRDLEQGLEQLKRMPSQDASMDIVPGSAPGQSDIVIKREPQTPWRVIVAADNSGSEKTGKWQESLIFAVDDPFGINDLFNISINGAASRDSERGTRGNSIYYSFPYGYWTFALSGSEYSYHQTVQGVSQNFVTSGETEQIDARASRGVYRTARSKTSTQFRIIRKKSKNFIEDVEIEVQRRDVTAAELGFNHRHYAGNAVLDLAWAYRKGVPWLGADDTPDSTGAPSTRYDLQTWDINFVVPFSMFDLNARYTLTARGQTTSDILFGSDQFAIGNRYSVRGFDGEQVLAAERGFYVRNELGFPLGETGQETYAGLDYGKVSGPATSALAGDRLVGGVLGVRGNFKKFLQYDVSAGWSLKKPDAFTTDRPTYAATLICEF